MKRLICIVTAGFLLGGCVGHDFHKTSDRQINEAEKTAKQTKADRPVFQPAYVVIDRPPVDLQPLGKINDPKWFSTWIKKKTIDNLPFGIAVRNAYEDYGLVVSMDHDLDQSKQVSLSYSGTLRGMLDEFSLASGYAYSIDGNRVNWHRMMTETFDISAMPGTYSHALGTGEEVQGGGSESTEDQADNVVRTNNKEYSSNVAELNIWADLSEVVRALMSKEGQFFVSQSSTAITVRDFPDNVRAVGRVVADFNRRMSAQVLLEARLVSVKLDQARSDGVDWDLVKQNSDYLLKFSSTVFSSGLTGASVPAKFAINATSPSSWDGSKILISALGEQGKTSVMTAPRQLTLNNQVAELRINTDTSYLASSSSVINDTTTETTLTPGVVTEGFTLYVLPKIDLANGEVFLQFSTTLSELKSLDTVESGTSSIQTPVLDQLRVNNRAKLHSGETLLLSGYMQNNKRSDSTEQFGNDKLGFRESEVDKTEILVLISASIVE